MKRAMRPTVLVIEDEEDIASLIRHHLSKERWQVWWAATGEEGIKLAREKRPSVVLLDLMLPNLDGREVCRQLRADPEAGSCAIIMVTAKGEEADILVGLEIGADDYIVKPFSPKVLIARIKAVLRRKAEAAATEASAVLKFSDLVIHPGKREVLFKGKPVDLTFTEFNILYFLARRPGWVFTRNQIIDAARGQDAISTDRAVDVAIVGLRRKLGPAGAYVETVRGVGYRFKEK
ncbi:MAG: response regulator transcription factor [Planctomycetota bacterium]|nr:response regulator transcription factor [Planctomycetota bacterium]